MKLNSLEFFLVNNALRAVSQRQIETPRPIGRRGSLAGQRALDVLRLAAKGFNNKAIGIQLGISDRTVQGHLAHIFAKMQATSRTEAVMRAVSLGWISHTAGEIAEK